MKRSSSFGFTVVFLDAGVLLTCSAMIVLTLSVYRRVSLTPLGLRSSAVGSIFCTPSSTEKAKHGQWCCRFPNQSLDQHLPSQTHITLKPELVRRSDWIISAFLLYLVYYFMILSGPGAFEYLGYKNDWEIWSALRNRLIVELKAEYFTQTIFDVAPHTDVTHAEKEQEAGASCSFVIKGCVFFSLTNFWL